MEAIETLEQWSAMATRTGNVTPQSLCDWLKTEHGISIWALAHVTVEEVMQEFVANYVG